MHRLSAATLLVLAAAAAAAGPPGRAQPPPRRPAGPVAPGGAVGPKKLALLVSVSNYTAKHPARKELGTWQNLNCYLDTRNMRQTLTAPKFGFADADVLVLDDLKATRAGRAVPGLAATRAGTLDAFRRHLVGQARPGDVVVFLYSGHGDQIADQPAGQPGGGDEADGYDEAFVPYDYAGTPAGDAKAYVRDDDLAALLKELKAKMTDPQGQVRGSINLIVDSCHSGTVTRGILKAKGRGAAPLARGPIEINAKGRAGSEVHDERPEGYVAISACQSNESAFEIGDEQDRPLGGALVYNLCRALREAPPDLTYRELFDRVRLHVKAAFFNQNPVVEGEVNRSLFGGTARALPEFPRVQAVEGGRVTLGAGRLLGVTTGSRYTLHSGDAAAAQGQGILAEVEVTAVDTYTSTTEFRLPAAAAERAKLTPARLLGRPAVLKSRPHGDGRLRVFLDGTLQLAAALKDPEVASTADPLTVTAAAGKGGYDFRITRTPPPGAAPGGLYLLRDDDTLVTQVPDDERAAAALRRALVRQWRWRTLSGLDGREETLAVDLRLIPVDVPLRADGTPDFAARKDRPAAACEKTPQGHLLLREGDYFRIELEYRGEARFVWITVLGLQQDGAIQPFFPHPAARVQESNRLSEDRRLLRPGGLFRVGPPFGLDVYKVLVTTQEVSFAALVDAPDNAETPEEARQKAAKARGLAAGTRGGAAPLAQLLLSAGQGTRATTHVAVDQRDWCATTVLLETRPR